MLLDKPSCPHIPSWNITFLDGDAPLKDTRSDVMIQFFFMNEVPLGPMRQASGLGFIVRHRSEPEVLRNRFSLV
jgi:hypothetical protein